MTEEEMKRNEKSGSRQDSIQGGESDANPGESPSLSLDPERFLLPISTANPVGEYLIYEGTYDRIKEARRSDDPNLPQGVWERTLKKADWKTVRSLSEDALENRSKDLQIAVWLMESLYHLHGFSGLAQGLTLLNRLCESFWEDMHPQPRNGDFDVRISPLIWVNEKFSITVKFQPVTRPKSVDSAAYTFADWERANLAEALPEDKKGAKDKKEPLTRARFLSSVMFTPRGFYDGLSNDLEECLASLSRLMAFLDLKCGLEGPSLTIFRNTLEDILSLCDHLLQEKSPEPPSVLEDGETEGSGRGQTSDYGYGKGDDMKYVALSIRSRAEAYRMMSDAADYLLVHEPHSPTPYLVKRAVSWGNKSLMELLQELVQDDRDLKFILNLLGMDP